MYLIFQKWNTGLPDSSYTYDSELLDLQNSDDENGMNIPDDEVDNDNVIPAEHAAEEITLQNSDSEEVSSEKAVLMRILPSMNLHM